jgi:hypothetical protein
MSFKASQLTSYTLPQNVSAKGGLSSPGAVRRILQIQELAPSNCWAAPCREPFLIGNLPRACFLAPLLVLLPNAVCTWCGLPPRVHVVRSVGMCGRSRYARRRMPALVILACGHVLDHASSTSAGYLPETAGTHGHAPLQMAGETRSARLSLFQPS